MIFLINVYAYAYIRVYMMMMMMIMEKNLSYHRLCFSNFR
jgi:hypothetical protein